jgi:AraC-like DNA-binding protein
MVRQQHPAPVARFDSEEVWRVRLGAAFDDLVPEPIGEQAALRGCLRGQRMGAAAMFIVSGSPQVVRRTTTAVRRAPGDLVKACIQVRGRATVHQDGREVVLAPGQLAVYDTGRPYALRLEGTWRCVVVALPRETLAMPSGELGEAMSRAYPAGDGPGLVLAEFVSSAIQRVGRTSPAAAARLGEAATSLLAGTLADDGDLAAGDAADDLREHVIAYMHAHLDDSRLSRGSVAAAHHMSPRTLDRLFAGQPWSVSAYIRNERLQAVHRDLRDPRLAHRSVAALAARWCFVDAAHFSRLFRHHFGYPPSQARPYPGLL